MNSAEDWATASRCADVLLRGHSRDEPALMVQLTARNPVLCGGPTEYFSQDMPVWHPKSPDEAELRPIDVLYGCYDPGSREIEIFINRIKQDASIYGADADELREIVRIHEYSHAVVHLGSRVDDVHDRLRTFGHDNRTEWPEFSSQRTAGLPTSRLNSTSSSLKGLLTQYYRNCPPQRDPKS